MARTASLLLAAFLSAPAFASQPAPAAPAAKVTPGNRVASIYVSQTLINELIHENLKTDLLPELKITLQPETGRVLLSGLARVPAEELRAINLEPGVDDFRFQVTVEPRTTRHHGYLILDFPLGQTFFYPASSADPARDRVIVPVQLLSLAVASARGYLAALSGDFSGFDRKTRQLKAQIAGLGKALEATKDPQDKDDLMAERERLRLELEAVPLERRQLLELGRTLQKVIGFAGEKEIDLNQELAARRNALVFRIKLAQLAPYLTGVELGGVRVLQDKRDGGGESFLAVDINSQLEKYEPPVVSTAPASAAARPGAAKPPLVAIRLRQALFESEEIVAAEQQQLGSRVRRFSLKLKDDGLHAFGEYKPPIIPEVPFKAVLDFTSVGPDVFDMRVRDIKVEHVELRALTRLVLDAAKERLDRSLKGLCTFQYVGDEGGRPAVRVTVDMPKMLPAFPDLRLLGVTARDGVLIMKAGRP